LVVVVKFPPPPRAPRLRGHLGRRAAAAAAAATATAGAARARAGGERRGGHGRIALGATRPGRAIARQRGRAGRGAARVT